MIPILLAALLLSTAFAYAAWADRRIRDAYARGFAAGKLAGYQEGNDRAWDAFVNQGSLTITAPKGSYEEGSSVTIRGQPRPLTISGPALPAQFPTQIS